MLLGRRLLSFQIAAVAALALLLSSSASAGTLTLLYDIEVTSFSGDFNPGPFGSITISYDAPSSTAISSPANAYMNSFTLGLNNYINGAVFGPFQFGGGSAPTVSGALSIFGFNGFSIPTAQTFSPAGFFSGNGSISNIIAQGFGTVGSAALSGMGRLSGVIASVVSTGTTTYTNFSFVSGTFSFIGREVVPVGGRIFVPEPSHAMLLLAGLGSMAVAGWRARRDG